MSRSASAVALIAVALLPALAPAQEHAAHAAVGTVDFPVSCSPVAREQVNTGMAMLHSFWFTAARQAFASAAQDDPGCGMAWAGAALTFYGNPMGGGTGPEGQARGAEAAARAVQVGARTARDSAWIAAVATLYRDHAAVPNRRRMQAYEQALAGIVAQYPDDAEARILHALAMVANAPPTDLTYARQHEAAKILVPLFERQPGHPGLAHYIIHAFDAPSLAHHALDAARRYAAIAPAAPHALHMPSHTFTRLGYWEESIATNRRSADAEEAPGARAHPLDYLVYAHLQQGRDSAARAAYAEVATATATYDAIGALGSYNGRAMPARLALERDDWAAARALPLAADPAPVRAVTQFARALGAARAGDLAAARAENDSLERVVDALRASGEEFWAHSVAAQHRAVSAWVAHLEGRHDDALRLAREAAELEDQVEKHPVTPGPLLPARELYGDLLLVHGRTVEALEAYEATMRREPRRLRTLHGAARAARAASREADARKYYGAIRELVDPASPHPALSEARAWLAAATPAP